MYPDTPDGSAKKRQRSVASLKVSPPARECYQETHGVRGITSLKEGGVFKKPDLVMNLMHQRCLSTSKIDIKKKKKHRKTSGDNPSMLKQRRITTMLPPARKEINMLDGEEEIILEKKF